MTTIVRSTKVSLKRYCNFGKQQTLFGVISDTMKGEIVRLTNEMLHAEKISALPDKSITATVDHESSWIRQVIAKEASSNARSIRNKLKKIRDGGNLQKYQEELLTKFNSRELKITWDGNIQLDSRFLRIEDSTDSTFDFWISFKWKGVDRFLVPLKLTRHMRNLINSGFVLKRDTLKVCQNGSIILVFQKEADTKINGDTIGIDIGRNKSFITDRSETEVFTKNILNSLKRQKHGSKNKDSRVRRLKQLIDSLIKQNIEWETIKTIVLENLTDMKRGRKWGNINHHWSHRYIQNRIQLLAETLGVQVVFVSPAYTSQTCSKCGHKHKDNRLGEKFLCLSCGNEMDADLNAAINIRKRGIHSTHGRETNKTVVLQ